MCTQAGLISMGAYLPAKKITGRQKAQLVKFLENETLLPREYIKHIDKQDQLPGTIETNYDGWERHPWFKTWLAKLPSKKHNDPFQGTKERRRVPLDPVSIVGSVIPHPMLPSDAETLAGALALVNGNIDKGELDLLITSSQVPDLLLPPNASLVQHKLQLKNVGAYAVETCCSSFITMLELGEALIKAGLKNKILIVASYIDSIITDKSDYFSVNTGDAAVAGVISRVEEGFGYITSHSTSHGSRHRGVILQGRSPNIFKTLVQWSHYKQEFVTFYDQEANKEIAANAQHDMCEVVSKALEKVHMAIDEIDFFVTHQPVHWAGHAWREALGIRENKFYESFQIYGNIANCSAPVNLVEAIERKFVKAGDLVLIASSGAGENHIAVVERITPQLIKALNNDQSS